MKASLISGVAHLGIRVHELARSRAFYERLGFEFVLGPAGPEPIAVLRHPSGLEVNLILNAKTDGDENVLMDVPEKHAGYTHVALTTPDLDAVLEHLSANGIEVSGGPMRYPGGARGLFVRDPDRNVVEFYQHAAE